MFHYPNVGGKTGGTDQNPQFPADLVTFTDEILNGKLHFGARISFNFTQSKSNYIYKHI